jgi:hypothetical protein
MTDNGSFPQKFDYRGKESLVALVRERKAHAVDRYTNLFRRASRWYDLYRGFYSGRTNQFRNNISIPFLFSVIQSDVARKAQTSFAGWPVVEFTGYGPEDAGVARNNELLVSAQMKDCGSFSKAVDFFLSADMYGTAICRVGWKEEKQMKQWRAMGTDPMGNPTPKVMKDNITVFDGPNWDVIDLLDFWPQPGKRRISECSWVIHRYYIDLDELGEQVKAGTFDQAGFNELKRVGSMPSIGSDFQERANVYRSWGEFEARRRESYSRPVEIWDMWGRVPSEFAPDGVVHRVVTLANGTVLLRNRPNPFWFAHLPFISYCPMQDPHYFHGPGKIEIAEKIQFAANRFANQKMDAVDLVIDPMWLINRQSGIDTQNLFTRSGKIIGVDGPIDDTVIRPLSPDLRGMQIAYQEIGQLWGWIQQATGIVEDTVQGGQGTNDRQTLGEFRGRQANVMTRLMLEARLADEGFVEPLADTFRALNRQFLTVPHQVKILGTYAVTNMITGRPLPQEPVNIGLDDINMDYRARAVGSIHMLGKEYRQQAMMMLMQAVSANPIAAQLLNWTAFFRQLFVDFEMRNLDELLMPEQSQLAKEATEKPQSPQQQQYAQDNQAMSGQVPETPVNQDPVNEMINQLQGQMR